jgi:hypothetical protein
MAFNSALWKYTGTAACFSGIDWGKIKEMKNWQHTLRTMLGTEEESSTAREQEEDNLSFNIVSLGYTG